MKMTRRTTLPRRTQSLDLSRSLSSATKAIAVESMTYSKRALIYNPLPLDGTYDMVHGIGQLENATEMMYAHDIGVRYPT